MNVKQLTRYRENNRLEAKKAAGGLPRSVWETYSAFANTEGGIILLGVEERADHSLAVAGVSHPEKMLRDFWNVLNNRSKISANILLDKHVRIEPIDGKPVIVIDVPCAERADRPIYINNDLFGGSFRRGGEGDYHCPKTAVQAMLRDAGAETQDTKVLNELPPDVFAADSVRGYRQRMRLVRPGHVWEALADDEFLLRLGAIARGNDARLHPTGCGLLMFGVEHEIVREFPRFFLDYQERFDADIRYTDRMVSTSGDWNGNVYDFFYKTYTRLAQRVQIPFVLANGRDRIEDTPVHQALREALANCLVNADYYGETGVVVKSEAEQITFDNPGVLRIPLGVALCGGISSPRNAGLMKMFNLLNIGERAGSGIPNILRVWHDQHWAPPVLQTFYTPEHSVLKVCVPPRQAIRSAGKKVPIKKCRQKVPIKSADKKMPTKSTGQCQTILKFMKANHEIRSADLLPVLNVGERRIKILLQSLVASSQIQAFGANKNRTYRLRENCSEI